jgi:hypothetical protein
VAAFVPEFNGISAAVAHNLHNDKDNNREFRLWQWQP